MNVSVPCIKNIRCIGIVLVALSVSACSIWPKPETLTVYQLPVTATVNEADTARAHVLPWSLRIATPYSSQVIDSQRVLVVPQGSQISAYSGVRWSDPGPVLVRNRLASAFRAHGQWASVSIDNSSLEADFELGGDLVAFQVVYQEGVPSVHIQYDASLTRPSANRSVATHSFVVTEPVQGTKTPEVIQAFGRAADKLAAAMLKWTLQYAINAK